MKEKIEKYFSDETYMIKLVKELENLNENSLKKEFIEKITSGMKPGVLIEELFAKAKNDNFALDMELADTFFLISELKETTKSELDFAIDMSIYLSEDEDSRDPEFNPGTRFFELKK